MIWSIIGGQMGQLDNHHGLGLQVCHIQSVCPPPNMPNISLHPFNCCWYNWNQGCNNRKWKKKYHGKLRWTGWICFGYVRDCPGSKEKVEKGKGRIRRTTGQMGFKNSISNQPTTTNFSRSFLFLSHISCLQCLWFQAWLEVGRAKGKWAGVQAM